MRQNRDYVLQPLDVIRVHVYQEEDINRGGEVRLTLDAVVTLPLIDKVDLKGLTIAQAEQRITKLYSDDYLVNPSISVRVIEYYKLEVQVFGQVTSPGVIAFPREEGLLLSTAISKAGSFTRLANRKSVTVKRVYPDGRIENHEINMEEAVKGKGTDIWLQPGDVINVPERFI